MSGSITPASVACIGLWKYCPEAQKLNGTHILVIMNKMQVILFKFNAETVEILKQQDQKWSIDAISVPSFKIFTRFKRFKRFKKF